MVENEKKAVVKKPAEKSETDITDVRNSLFMVGAADTFGRVTVGRSLLAALAGGIKESADYAGIGAASSMYLAPVAEKPERLKTLAELIAEESSEGK